MNSIHKILSNLDFEKPIQAVQSLYLKKKPTEFRNQLERYRFQIDLENPKHIYNAGDTVSGNIFLLLNHKISVKGIKVKLIGEATTNCGGKVVGIFRELLALDSKDSEHIIYRIQKVFAHDAITESPSILWISPGTYQFPFSFQLPTSLPSSFTQKFGQIKYSLEASLLGSHKYSRLHLVNIKEISISAIVDLCSIPNSQTVVRLHKQCNVGIAHCLCNGLVGFNLMIKKNGYVPGEKIPFTVYLYNRSQRTVAPITLSLVQVTIFQVGVTSHESRKTVRQMDGPTLRPGAREVWQRDNLRMHCVPPTGFGKCKIIEINYILKIKLKVNYNSTLKAEVPLVIGTIGYRSKSEEHHEKCQSWNETRFHPKSILKNRKTSM